jgi:glycosyltransferase involved in cell wall biosynthesis
MQTPINISIVVPVYNSAPFLTRCLNSLCGQTLVNIEIICVDDASTDNSLSILNTFKAKDKRIKLIHNTENLGAGMSRNSAMKVASGEFIGFCDSDDYIDAEYYEALYKHSTDADIVRGIRVIDANNRHAKNPFGCIVPSIIRREFLTKNNLKFPISRNAGEDSTFKRWCYKKNPRIIECKDMKCYYHYMRREGSLSNYKFQSEIKK